MVGWNRTRWWRTLGGWGGSFGPRDLTVGAFATFHETSDLWDNGPRGCTEKDPGFLLLAAGRCPEFLDCSSFESLKGHRTNGLSRMRGPSCGPATPTLSSNPQKSTVFQIVASPLLARQSLGNLPFLRFNWPLAFAFVRPEPDESAFLGALLRGGHRAYRCGDEVGEGARAGLQAGRCRGLYLLITSGGGKLWHQHFGTAGSSGK